MSIIGLGAYGDVIRDGQTAIKITENTQSYLPESLPEVTISQLVNHPYLLRADNLEITRNQTKITFPLALMDLEKFLITMKPKPDTLKKILYQVGLGLKYLHEHNIVHGDLKATNILIFKDATGWIPKICDYGSSTYVQFVRFSYGTYLVSAPEVLQGITCTPLSDVWSFGLLISYLLLNDFIFTPKDPHNCRDILRMIQARFKSRFDFNEKTLPHVDSFHHYMKRCGASADMIDLLDRIFMPMSQRPTMDDVLQDPFFVEYREELEPSSSLLRHRISGYLDIGHWQKLTSMLITLAQKIDASIDLFLTALDLIERYSCQEWIDDANYVTTIFNYTLILFDSELYLSNNVEQRYYHAIVNRTHLNFIPQTCPFSQHKITSDVGRQVIQLILDSQYQHWDMQKREEEFRQLVKC